MARDEDEDQDDGLPPIGEGTVDALADAKKGKPRNFLLIAKGNKLKYVVVKKKPVKKGQIAEAKKLGYKGDAYIGVITGSGLNLVFNLAKSDGYDSAPCKEKSLKDFLGDHADLKCSPTFAIVETPPEIPFDEEDLNNPLIARFLGLTNLVNEVVDKKPESLSEIQTTVNEIRSLLQDGDFVAAEPRIDTFEARLKQLLTGEESPQPNQVDSGDDALRQKLLDALNKLVPQLKKAVENFPEKKSELLSPVAEIKKQIDQGQLQEAKQGLLNVSQLLKSLASSSQQPEDFSARIQELEPLMLQAIKANPEKGSALQNVWTYALKMVSEQNAVKAKEAFDKLEVGIRKILQEAPKTDTERFGIREGIVAERKQELEQFFIARVQAAKQQSNVQIQSIEQAISSKAPDQDPDELAEDVQEEIENLYNEVRSELLTALGTEDTNVVTKAVEKWREAIRSNPLVKHLGRAKSDIGANVQVADDFENLFDEVTAKINELAPV